MSSLPCLLGLLVLVDMKARTTKSSSLYTFPNDGYQLGKADLANVLLEERPLLIVDQTPLLELTVDQSPCFSWTLMGLHYPAEELYDEDMNNIEAPYELEG